MIVDKLASPEKRGVSEYRRTLDKSGGKIEQNKVIKPPEGRINRETSTSRVLNDFKHGITWG